MSVSFILGWSQRCSRSPADFEVSLASTLSVPPLLCVLCVLIVNSSACESAAVVPRGLSSASWTWGNDGARWRQPANQHVNGAEVSSAVENSAASRCRKGCSIHWSRRLESRQKGTQLDQISDGLSGDRRLVLDAERHVVGVDAVEPERLQEEPLRRAGRREAEGFQPEPVQHADERCPC
jgi:hypothetical protein